jgi:4-hydroxy-tetrahydrodipicolinate synthase
MAGKFSDAGVEAVVSTLPAYYPMEDRQISAYIEKLADLLPLPLILYNMPGTIGYSIPLDIMERMSYHPNIIGIKDSERDTDRLDRSLEFWSGRQDFSYWLGWAAMSLHAIKNGADGIVPSTGNLVPGMYNELYQSVLEGDMETAGLLQEKTNEISLLYQKDRKLNRSLPALKVLLSIEGLCQPYVIPPLLRMEENEEQQYMEKMKVELKRLTR